MLSLYEILKASKTGIAPDMWTALAGKNWGGADSGHEVKELTGIPPLTFRADGTPLLDFLISGNMSQSGTPSPTTPIQPQGTGERTGNLWDISQVITNSRVINQGNSLKVMIPSTSTGATAAAPNTLQDYCPTLNIGDEVTLSFETTGSTKYIYLFGENISWASGQSKTITATMLNSVVIWYASGTDTEAIISNIMLNTGSTALPYEPYGYKIPISSANTTTPVYLGEVQTTRKIKKYEMTGNEDITYQSAYSRFFFIRADAYYTGTVRTTPCICSHYQSIHDGRAIDDVPNESIYIATADNKTAFNIKTTDFTDATDFKSYLAQQYAAGTPVTVWYVLATETTGIVNEPIRKIGDYADTLSMEQAGAQIPTNRGNTVIDVETTLKPSQMYIKYQE